MEDCRWAHSRSKDAVLVRRAGARLVPFMRASSGVDQVVGSGISEGMNWVYGVQMVWMDGAGAAADSSLGDAVESKSGDMVVSWWRRNIRIAPRGVCYCMSSYISMVHLLLDAKYSCSRRDLPFQNHQLLPRPLVTIYCSWRTLPRLFVLKVPNPAVLASDWDYALLHRPLPILLAQHSRCHHLWRFDHVA